MNENKFVYAIFIETTPEKLWEALTSGEFTQKYWASSEFSPKHWTGSFIESDFKVGSRLTMYANPEKSKVDFSGEILKSEPPKLLSYTFDVQTSGEAKAEKPSFVTFEIEPLEAVVKLTVTHEEIASGLEEITRGWQGILSSLKTLLETGKPLPESFWNWYKGEDYKTA
jgi:uncharacterized protein YndB with AHSA1/START domain